MNQDITTLYDQLHTELIKWCCLMTQSPDNAEELVQEGFLRVIEHWPEIKDLSFPQQRAWLYQTIKHLFIDSLRKNKREYLTGEVQDVLSVSSQDKSIDDYTEKEWMELINSLPPVEGKILVLRYVEGFTSSQISTFLHIPAGTVRSKLHDARKHLRERL